MQCHVTRPSTRTAYAVASATGVGGVMRFGVGGTIGDYRNSHGCSGKL